MGRKLKTIKQKGKPNRYFIGDKQISEKEFTKIYTDAVNEGKKVNPDFKPRSIKEITSPATLKKRSGFKLRSGNKPSIAKLSGVSPNKKTKLTDKITAALNAPFESASYKDLKRAYRGARKQGFDPKNLSKDQLDKLLEGKKKKKNQSYRVER